MGSLTSEEQKIFDTTKHYQSYYPVQLKGSKNDWECEQWYKAAYQHLRETLLPKIEENGEVLVEYWVTFFLWGSGAEYSRAYYEDHAYLRQKGTFGTGYTCLTLSNLYVVSLKQATEMVPLFPAGVGGFMLDVLGRMQGKVNDRRPLKEDRMYVIPCSSISGAQIIQDKEGSDIIALRTVNDQFFIQGHFRGDRKEIVLAIRMVKTGKLAQMLGLAPKPPSQPSIISEESSVEKLKQLKQMMDLGLISKEEYEAKKANILSNM